MGFKEFCSKMYDEFKENNKPENVKKKLESQLEIEKLKLERDKISDERRKMKSKSIMIGDFKMGRE